MNSPNSVMKREYQPLFGIQLALCIVSVFCFLFILADTTTNQRIHEQNLFYSFWLMILTTTSIVGFKKISGSWRVYLVGIIPLMLFAIPTLIFSLPYLGPTSVNGWLVVAAIIIASGILLLISGEFRYVATNGIFLGSWFLLGGSYLWLQPKYGTVNTINVLFTDYGMSILFKFIWFAFVFPLAVSPLVNFLQLPLFRPKFQPNTDDNSYYEEHTENFFETQAEEAERIFQLEVQSDSLRFSQANRSEVKEIDDELGRSYFDSKYEDDKFDYHKK